MVGGASPRSPQVLRSARATSTRRGRRVLVVAHRLDPLPQVRRDQARAHQGLREVSRAALAQQVPPACRRSLLAVVAVPRRRLRRCSSGASSCRRCCCGTARSPSTRCRTCSARAATRRPTTRRTTGCSRSSPCGEGWHNNHHHYQCDGEPGLLLVGDRRQLLRAQGAVVARPGVGSAHAAQAHPRRRQAPVPAARRRPSRCRRASPLARSTRAAPSSAFL